MTDQEDYQAEWEDVPEKVILAQIMTELQQIRLLLQERDTRASDGGEVVRRCQRPTGRHTPKARTRPRQT